MKRIIVMPLFLFILGCASNDRVIILENKIAELEIRINELEARLVSYEKTVKKPTKTTTKKKTTNLNQVPDTQIAPLPLTSIKENSINTTSGRCQAITKAGTQCSRNSKGGSDYCWQHQSYNKTTTQEKSSSYTGDKTIYTGPRGGQYYYNSKGNKVYIKKKK